MLTIKATDARKNWSEVLDSVVRHRPAFIKRTRDYLMLCSVDMMAEFICPAKIIAEVFTEEDGSVTLSTADMDIVAVGSNIGDAKKALAQNIMEYAEEYYEEFERYSKAPNRKSHLPYVMKVLAAKSPEELEGMIQCQAGEI